MEKRQEVKVFKVTKHCDKCSSGTMEMTGNVNLANPAQYQYLCSNPNCNNRDFYSKSYPYIQYEEVEEVEEPSLETFELENRFTPMSLDTKPGQLVRYKEKNGLEVDIKFANEHLTKNNIYKVKEVIIRSWSSDVILEGFSDLSFNSVMFENYEKPECDLEKSMYTILELEKIFEMFLNQEITSFKAVSDYEHVYRVNFYRKNKTTVDDICCIDISYMNIITNVSFGKTVKEYNELKDFVINLIEKAMYVSKK